MLTVLESKGHSCFAHWPGAQNSFVNSALSPAAFSLELITQLKHNYSVRDYDNHVKENSMSKAEVLFSGFVHETPEMDCEWKEDGSAFLYLRAYIKLTIVDCLHSSDRNVKPYQKVIAYGNAAYRAVLENVDVGSPLIVHGSLEYDPGFGDERIFVDDFWHLDRALLSQGTLEMLMPFLQKPWFKRFENNAPKIKPWFGNLHSRIMDNFGDRNFA